MKYQTLLSTLLLAASAVALQAQSFTNYNNAPFSAAANWSPNGVPTNGAVLTFGNLNPAGYIATNDLGAAFLLNKATLAPQYGYVFGAPRTFVGGSVTNAPGSSLAFTGASAGIVFNGPAAAAFDAATVLATNATISGASHGHLYVGAELSGPGRLTVNRTGAGQTILSGANSYSGNTVLSAGILSLGTPGALGTGLLTNGGGSLRADVFSGPDGLIITNDVRANADVIWGGNNSGVLAGQISGARGVRVEPNTSITLHLRGANTFTGAVVTGYSPSGSGASLTFGGADGAALNSTNLSVGRFGTLKLDNATANNLNRIADTAPIASHRGTLELAGSASAASSETVGVILGGGSAFVQVRAGAGQSAVLTASNLARLNGGVFNLRGSNLGSNAPGAANVGSLLLADGITNALVGKLKGGGGAAGSTTVSILPWAAAHNTIGGAGNSLATYDLVNGFRPLDLATEFSPTLVNDTTNSENARLTNAMVNIDGSAEVNALVLDRIASGVAPGRVGGAGTLRLASGALWNVGPASVAGTGLVSVATLDFGASEGVIWNPETLFVHSTVTGTNGFTKSGGGELFLLGTSAVTGPLTIGGGFLSVPAVAHLGAPASLVLNGGSVRSRYAGSESLTTPALLGGANGGFDVNLASGDLSASGQISGGGFLIKDGAGTLTLAASNTFTGNTVINAGVLAISAANQLASAANIVLLPGGTFRNTAPITLANAFTLQAGGGVRGIETLADLTLSGAIGHAGSPGNALNLTKTGAGALILGGNNSFNGPLFVNAGRLVVNGSLASINAAGDGVIITNGASLAGAGTVNRDVYLAAGTPLEVGGTTLSINGSVTVEGGLNVAVNGSLPVFNVRGALRFNGGTVTVTFTNGSLPRGFTLFSADSTTGALPTFVVDTGGNEALAALGYQVVQNGPRFDLVPSRYAYELVDLGTLGGPTSFALDVNNLGQVSGNSRYTTTNTRLHGFIWDNGVMTDLGFLPGVEFSRGYALNDSGAVVGESDNDIPKAFIWTNGVLANLGTLGGASAVAHDINEAGEVVGASSNGSASRPFRRLPDGTFLDLGTLLGTTNSSGRAWAINNLGVAVGLSRNASNTTSHATMWIGGSVSNLGSLLGGTNFSQAYGVNDANEAVGTSVRGKVSPTSSTDLNRSFHWREGVMTELPVLSQYPAFIHSEAKDINECGDMAGNVAQFFGSPTSGGAAVLWRNGEACDLNTLIAPGSGWNLQAAEGLNDLGDIVGFASFGGNTRAFLLRFVPVLLTNQHVDIGIAFEDGAFDLHLHNETQDIEYSPMEAHLVVQAPAYTTVPNDPRFAFLGLPCSGLWVLPNTQDTNLVFLGFAAEEIEDGVFQGDVLRMDLRAVSGPGDFIVYDFDSFGNPVRIMSSRDGVDTNDFKMLVAGAHQDLNWAFTAPGRYTVTFEASGTLTNGDFVTSGPVKYTFVVQSTNTPPVILTNQHVDIGFAFEDGAWEPHLHNETDEAEYPPDGGVLLVRAAAFARVPDDARFAFLGAGCTPVWVLPNTQNTNLLFLGFGAEEIGNGVFTNDEFRVNLLGVAGPGSFFVYDFDSFGDPVVFMNSADGISTNDFKQLVAGAHQDLNWAFTAPGIYRVTFEAVGTLTNGTVVSSGPVDYTFCVEAGPIPLTAPFLTITRTPTNRITLAWNGESGATYQLQSTASFPPAWTNEGVPIVGVCGPHSVTLPASNAAAFYQLVTTSTLTATGTIVFHIYNTNFTLADIWAVEANGSGLRRLTTNAVLEFFPRWSPDGTRIAYNRRVGGSTNGIFVMNADGSDPVQITPNSISATRPDWSPDGTQFTFHSTVSGNTDVWAIQADGTNLRRLTTDAGSDRDPVWSPDGLKIAFRSNRSGTNHLCTINPDGSGFTDLTPDGEAINPAWSPDGSKLAFHAKRGTPLPELFVMNADGTGVTQVTSNASEDYTVAWSPNGLELIYNRVAGGFSAIHIIGVNGANERRLGTIIPNDTLADWK